MIKYEKVRIGIIGLGKIAQKAYLPITANHPQVIPVLCTRNIETLNKVATKYRIEEAYNNIDELINSGIDAVMVHSSTESHFEIVKNLIEAQIPTFVDKPLCYSFNKVDELLNLAIQNQVLLYLGFNRRFAPFIQSLKNQVNPLQIIWQKNRVNLPENPRMFIFDDFIHVIDSLRFLTPGPIQNLQVSPIFHENKLGSIHVHWNQDRILLNGRMNRISGITEERIEYYSLGNKWLIEELNHGIHYKNGKKHPMTFDNWQTTLYKRGFVDLFEDFLKALQSEIFNINHIQDIRETHKLCEEIINNINPV